MREDIPSGSGYPANNPYPIAVPNLPQSWTALRYSPPLTEQGQDLKIPVYATADGPEAHIYIQEAATPQIKHKQVLYTYTKALPQT